MEPMSEDEPATEGNSAKCSAAIRITADESSGAICIALAATAASGRTTSEEAMTEAANSLPPVSTSSAEYAGARVSTLTAASTRIIESVVAIARGG